MNVKLRKRRDSIEKLQQQRITNLQKQSKYFQSLLTESLPKYYGGNYGDNQKVSQNLVQAKRLYFADSPEKISSRNLIKDQKEKESPLKLKKRSPQKSRTPTPKGILKQTQSLRNTERQGKSPEKQKQQNKSQNKTPLHPYSIILKLQKSQAKLSESQKTVYKYREIHDLKTYTEEEIDDMIDELLNKSKKSKDENKISVTDQFILSRFFDLKVRKVIQKKKEKPSESKTSKCKPPSRAGSKEVNPQLLKAFQEIKFVWDFYELKLQHCPDLIKGNQKDERIYTDVKVLYLDLMKLEDQIKQEENASNVGVKDLRDPKKQMNCHPKKLTDDVVAKKVKAIMKRFKEIMLAN